jgi:hypothetical protein
MQFPIPYILLILLFDAECYEMPTASLSNPTDFPSNDGMTSSVLQDFSVFLPKFLKLSEKIYGEEEYECPLFHDNIAE